MKERREAHDHIPAAGTEISAELLHAIKREAQELAPELEARYKDFHEHPELGGQEVRTAARVKEYLQQLGVEIIAENIGVQNEQSTGTGIIARIKGKEGGPTVALRADMDALPIQEDASHEPRSATDGVMHACGHDAHTTGLLGAASILKGLADRGELSGNVVLLFQPSEEKAHQKESGAVQMVRALEKSGTRKDIDAFFGVHVRSDHERGWVNLRDGVQFGSSGEVDIKLKGHGGHILNAYEVPNLHLIFSELTTKLADVFRPLKEKNEALVASARTRYSGSGYNVLPAEAESTWVIRVTSELYRDIRQDILEQIRGIVAEIVAKHDTQGEVLVSMMPRHGYRPGIHRDPNLVQLADATSATVVGNYHRVQETEAAGEDFAFYMEDFRGREIPGIFLSVGAASPGKGIPLVPHHSPQFRIDRGVLPEISALHATLAVNALKHFERRNATSTGNE